MFFGVSLCCSFCTDFHNDMLEIRLAWGKELWAMADQEGRQKEAETGKGSLKTTAWSW